MLLQSLDGFVHYLNQHAGSKQWKYLKFGLARLAREHPEANPREVLFNWLMNHFQDYEMWVDKHNSPKNTCILCDSGNVKKSALELNKTYYVHFVCQDCGYSWNRKMYVKKVN